MKQLRRHIFSVGNKVASFIDMKHDLVHFAIVAESRSNYLWSSTDWVKAAALKSLSEKSPPLPAAGAAAATLAFGAAAPNPLACS